MKRLVYIAVSGAILFGISGCGEALNEAIKNTMFDANKTYEIADNASIDSSNKVATNIVALKKITLIIHMDHSRAGDLKITLVDPDGTGVVLADHRGGDHNISNSIMFTSSGTEAPMVTDTDFPDNYKYQAEGNLSLFLGNNPNGTWHLKITDDVSNGKQGKLNSWVMLISGAQ